MVPEDDIGPGFAYTIGLAHTHGEPELAMFGLDIHAMHRMLNRLGAKSAAGAVLTDGQRHPDVGRRSPSRAQAGRSSLVPDLLRAGHRVLPAASFSCA
ncbi:DUF4262 domain-containing protein, partial [Streptomyces sp. 24-1644]|uniref:DUF4262 domain-containing protein n=1 Tax=Streptomyces sp. 24-1644 TaxID=3457315 RepID=UPI003FA6FA7F